MKRYIYIVIGLILLAGGVTYFYFKSSKIELVNAQRILTVEEYELIDRRYYVDTITLQIEVSKPITNLEHFIIINNKTEKEIKVSGKLLDSNDNTYEIGFSNLTFGHVTYTIKGYTINGQVAYFGKPLDIEVNDPYPIRVLDFNLEELVEVNDSEIKLDIQLYNPLDFTISEIKYQINEEYKSVVKDIVQEKTTDILQMTTVNIENILKSETKIELVSITIIYQGFPYEYIIDQDFSKIIDVYTEIELVEFIAPTMVYAESKTFNISLKLKKNTEKNINGIKIKINGIDKSYDVEEIKEHGESNEYIFVIDNKNDNSNEITITIIEIVYEDNSCYKIDDETQKIAVKRVLDQCVLRTKSAQVMTGSKHAFYLECSFIDDKVTLYKFFGTFNGIEIVGQNYISLDRTTQNTKDFGFIDVNSNIISLITLPVEKENGKMICTFEINKLVYFYNNQEIEFVINQSVWVIPEDPLTIIKTFKMTQNEYTLPDNKPIAIVELLMSNTITVDSITLEVNNKKIVTSFKDGGIKTVNGTIVFNCQAFVDLPVENFQVKLLSIEYNGQGTKKVYNVIDQETSYAVKR